jgi:hypothetical protein
MEQCCCGIVQTHGVMKVRVGSLDLDENRDLGAHQGEYGHV